MDKDAAELLDLICLLGGEPAEQNPIEGFQTVNAIVSHYIYAKGDKGSDQFPFIDLVKSLKADNENQFIDKLKDFFQVWVNSTLSGKLNSHWLHVWNYSLDKWLVQTYGKNAEWLKYAMINVYALADECFLQASIKNKNRAVLKEALDTNLKQAYWYFQGLNLLKGKVDLLETKTINFPLTSFRLGTDTLVDAEAKDTNSQPLLNRLLRYSHLRNTVVNYDVTCKEPCIKFSYCVLPEGDPQGMVPKMMLVPGTNYCMVLDAIDKYITVTHDGKNIDLGYMFTKVSPRLSVNLPFSSYVLLNKWTPLEYPVRLPWEPDN